MSTTPNPYQNALLASNNADELKTRISALKAEKAGITLDPDKPVEDEVEAMLKAESKIDVKIVQLERTLEVLVRKLPELWERAEVYIRPLAITATEETYALREEGRALALRAYGPLMRGGTIGAGLYSTFGYAEACDLEGSCISLFRARPEPDLPGRMCYLANIVEFLDALPGRTQQIRSMLERLKAAAEELERRLPYE